MKNVTFTVTLTVYDKSADETAQMASLLLSDAINANLDCEFKLSGPVIADADASGVEANLPERVGPLSEIKSSVFNYERLDIAERAARDDEYIFAFLSSATGTLLYAVTSDPSAVAGRKAVVQMRGPIAALDKEEK